MRDWSPEYQWQIHLTIPSYLRFNNVKSVFKESLCIREFIYLTGVRLLTQILNKKNLLVF